MRSKILLENLRKQIKYVPVSLNEEEFKVKQECEESLYTFARYAWPWIEGGKEFQGGWHIQAIAEHLELTYTGKIRELLINQPPRTMKSTLVAVIFPAWCWTIDPSMQFLYASYAHTLSMRDSVKCRRLIESPWYQKLWGSKFTLVGDSNTKVRFDNTKMGYRIASSVGGTMTGEGGDFLVVDDGNNAKEVGSEVIRTSTNEWWDQVMSTRLNNPKTGRKIIVQQRLHEMDLTGHILAKDNPELVHLRIPMEFEQYNRCITVPTKSTRGKKWSDPRKKEGELLWPDHIGPKELYSLKQSLGSEYVIAGQLQQRPSPAEGGIIKKDWWNWWTESAPPRCKFVVQSWDTALSTIGCYSACSTWGVFDDDYGVPNVVLLDLWRGRVEYPELREMAQRLAKNYHDTDIENPMGGHIAPDLILVEAKANGLSLIQDLRRAGVMATRFDPTKYGDKITRARLITPLIECGRVWVPAKPPHYNTLRSYAHQMVELASLFPNAESNDLVDSMSQAFIRLLNSGWIRHREDDIPLSKPNPHSGKSVY